jgi:hypothetical protein
MKRQPAKLSDSLSHRLNSYALAASAAGVSVLALARPAGATVVYTPQHTDCSFQGCIIDLLNNKMPEFTVNLATTNFGRGSGTYVGNLTVTQYHSFAPSSDPALVVVPENARFRGFYAAALHAGARIGTAPKILRGREYG